MPQFDHVIVLVEENQDYDDIVGSAAMPYLNGLANQYGLATKFYGNTHPSLGNYFVMTTGEVVTNDNNFACAVTVDNLVRQFAAAGKTWKAYAESLPSVGYTGGDVYPYSKHHNPFAYFSDVLASATQKQNIVPMTQFAADLASDSLPNFSFIVPNMQSNMHDCPPGIPNCTLSDRLAYGDQWLQNNMGPLISNPVFQQQGLLVITFDEANKSDSTNGGGRIATVLVSPKVKPGYRSTTLYQHEHLLRTFLTALGMNSFIGASKYVGDMAEFFQSGGATGSIGGSVTNAVTGAPIVGAVITGPGSAITDTAGNYVLSSITAGTYTLGASAGGYQSSTGTVTVPSGGNVTQNFTLTPATTSSFAGRVTSAVDGRAIAGVTVSYSGGTSTTDSSGNYVFATVTLGTYDVTATKTGWGKLVNNVTVGSGTATLNFQLATSGQIKGSVTNSSGGAIAGATVTITGGIISTTKSLTTSSSGAYASGWIPVGNYTVKAQSGTLSKTQNVNVATGQTLTVNLTLP